MDDGGVLDLGFARLDVDRERRTGDPEVVYGAGKTPEQVVDTLVALHARHPDRAILATRLDDAARSAVRAALPDAVIDDVARAATLGPLPVAVGLVAVLSAGTSDAPVAAEAALTARVHGTGVDRIDDVGVAGLHRLLAVRDRITAADCLIVVAGMEGALPSVVGGLTGVPLVAVPTSIGYGTGLDGLAAIMAMLNSCAPGIVVVNIDNGYGAGVHAAPGRPARPAVRVGRMSSASGRIGWIDATSGASGDMLLGAVHDALLALGMDTGVMDRAAAAVVPVGIEVGHEQRVGFQVARAHVTTSETVAPHRTWADVRLLLESADLDGRVRRLASEAFSRLATAEARVHGVEPEAIHFHEVGAHDAIGDIVGVCAGFVALDLAELHVSPIALGGGTATTSHGVIPIPGPAVLELLRHSDLVAHGGPVDEELCTPTGAALLTTLATTTSPMPPMSVQAIGLGAGSRHTGVGLSALRLVVGSPSGLRPADVADVVLETNVDDLDPRLWPGVLAALLDAGASDAWLTPILMKKGRPAHTLHVLVGPNPVLRQQIRNVMLTETSAIGLRETSVHKTALARREYLVELEGQRIRVKVALDDRGTVVNVQPEYDDIAAAATALGRPAKQILAEAAAAARTPVVPDPLA